MWTIDIGYFNTSQWLRTAGRYATVDDAVTAMLQLPRSTSCIYRVRVCDSVDAVRPCAA